MPTTLRRTTVELPVAGGASAAAGPTGIAGPENPLPALAPLDEMHTIGEEERAALPPDMARQVGYAPLRSVLPVRVLDGYTRDRAPAELDAIVLENDRLRATVLPGLGGRVHSLRHKPTGRELLYTNPVLQPADFALNGAWYSGGIEWNIGATGHTTLSVAPLHAARVPAPDGGPMLRLWEWERLRDTPFQVDLWLPDGSDFLYVGARIRNPHDWTVPVYWWSNIAVPEDEATRVLVPADETWYFAYERRLRRIPVPEWDGADRTYALRSEFPADYFYEIPREERKWIASLDAGGTGLVQTSTALLRGRKLFVWGHGPGGRRWQEWLTEPGTGGYAEIQAGLARTQLEHVPLEAGGEFAWLEAYGPLTADPEAVHGTDWAAAREHTTARLEETLPAADVDAAYEAWRPYADVDPGEIGPEDAGHEGSEPRSVDGARSWLAVGSGWGALEVARGGYELPGTPFPAETMGEQQRPWLELLRNGRLADDGPGRTANGSGTAPARGNDGPDGRRPDPSASRATSDTHTSDPGAEHGSSGGQSADSRARTAGSDVSGGTPADASKTPGTPAAARLSVTPPGPTLVSEPWRDQLECAPSGPLTDYHLGVAQWHAGDRAQAVRSWERSAAAAPSAWSLRCLGFADAYDAATGLHPERAADRYLAALDLASAAEPPALAALVREAVPVLLAAGRTDGAAEALDRLPPEYRDRGRFRLLRAQVLAARGEKEAARAVFDAGFEVDDLREGDEVLAEVWAELSDGPLPARYDFRMRPA